MRKSNKNIDKSMQGLIRELNDHGLKTTQCCSGHGKDGEAYISIDMRRSIKDVAVRMIDGYPRLVVYYTDLLGGPINHNKFFYTLSEFEQGILYAVATLVRPHKLPAIAASIVREAGLGNMDISKIGKYDRDSLRMLNSEEGIAFRGVRRLK